MEVMLGVPTVFALEQNYPNPCNPATSISFSLPVKSFVSLKVFDLEGKEVATVVDEELSIGKYTQQWNASSLASGIYFYRLSAILSVRRDLIPSGSRDGRVGGWTETKKLVLLK